MGHIDYKRWVTPGLSIDMSVTPLLMVNQAHLGLTWHLLLDSSDESEKSLMIWGNAGAALLACCGGGYGPGIQVGYANVSPRTNRGVSYSVGVLLVEMFGAPNGIAEVRMTWWRVSR